MNIQNQLEECQYQKDIADAECEKLRSKCEKRQQQGELEGEQRAILRVDRNLMELTFENARLRQSVEVHQKAIHQFKEMCFKRETSIKKQQVEALTNAHELLKEIDELKAEMKTLKADNEAKTEILLKYKEFKKEAVDSDNQWREKNEYQVIPVNFVIEFQKAILCCLSLFFFDFESIQAFFQFESSSIMIPIFL